MAGTVEQIFLADPESPAHSVDSVLAIMGRGLEGDRHLASEQTWAPSGCAISLIEAALHRAGLRADILAGGRIAVGDSVLAATEAPPALA